MTRNLPSSVLTAMPTATHRIADYERAFHARRQAIRCVSEAATLAGRILHRMRGENNLDTGCASAPPTMSWVDGPRSQPRDGRGRFLPRTWLADAELFLPADRAWFRSPISSEAK